MGLKISAVFFLFVFLFMTILVSGLILVGDSSYSSTNLNVSNEVGFAHLNISTASPYDKLMLYFSFDDNLSSTIVYDYGNLNFNGAYNGSAGYNSSGVYGGGLGLNGMNNSFVKVDPMPMNTTNNFTFSWWVNPANINQLGMMINYGLDNGAAGNGSGVGLGKGNGGSAGANLTMIKPGIAWVDLNYTFPSAKTWYNIVWVQRDGTTSIFINGINYVNKSNSITLPNKLDIGGQETVGRYFNGTLDDVMLFNTTLTDAQVRAIYNNQSLRFFSQGEQQFLNQNVSGAGTEDRLNVSLIDYQSLLVGNISVFVNGGAEVWLNSSGSASNIQFTEDPNIANITFKYYAGTSQFYSPLMVGNITLTSWFENLDADYPVFYNYTDNNATLIVSGVGTFSANVNGTNGSVILHVGNSDIEASNTTSDNFNATYTFSSAGTYVYNWTAYGNGTNHNLNTSVNQFYTVNVTPDNDYPLFSNIRSNNGSLIDSGTATFNATISSTNGTAFLEFNGVNYTASNITASEFNVTLSVTSGGVYSYYWGSWGNGTNHNYNTTASKSYTINISDTVALPMVTKRFGDCTTCDVVNITMDAGINYAQPTTNIQGNSTGITLRGSLGNAESVLYYFNLSTIPQGSKIVDAKLVLFVNQAFIVYNSGVIKDVYILNDTAGTGLWNETTVTYNTKVGATTWDSGNFSTSVGANTSRVYFKTWVNQLSSYVLNANLTSAAQGWVNNPDSNMGLALALDGSGLNIGIYAHEATDSSLRPYLQVTYNNTQDEILGNVTNISAKQYSGQTFITWDEVNTTSNETGYYIYRSTTLINSTSLVNATRLDYVRQGSSYISGDIFGRSGSAYITQPNLSNAGVTLNNESGLYVYTDRTNESAYYAVTLTVEGNENRQIVTDNNTISSPVTETTEHPDAFVIDTSSPYTGYVFWLSNWNPENYSDSHGLDSRASNPFFFSVAAPFSFNSSINNYPLTLHLHSASHGYFDSAEGYDNCLYVDATHYGGYCLGFNSYDRITFKAADGNLYDLGSYLQTDQFGYSYYSGWNNKYEPVLRRGDVIKTNNYVYPLTDGYDIPYTEKAILYTIHWMQNYSSNYSSYIDNSKVYSVGGSLGAGGSLSLAIHYPNEFAAIDAVQGRLIGQYTGYDGAVTEAYYGPAADNITMPDGTLIYDYLNMSYWLIHERDKNLSYPYIRDTHGKADTTISWGGNNVTDWYNTTQLVHLPIVIYWDNSTHNSFDDSLFLPEYIGTRNFVSNISGNTFNIFDFAINRSYPAFSNFSLNGYAGNGSAFDGDLTGSYNQFIWYNNSNMVDNSSTYSVDVYLQSNSPSNTSKVDITPTRIQNFNVNYSNNYTWTLRESGTTVQTGTITPDIYNQLVVPSVNITNDTRTLTLAQSSTSSDTTPPTFTGIPPNDTITYGTYWSGEDFNATDETLFDSFAVNDSRFTINASGFLNTTKLLGVAAYTLNITINDSSNNIASLIYNLSVTKADPSTWMSISGTTPITYGTTSNFAGSELNGGDADLVYSLDKTNKVYGVGTTTFNYSTPGGANYTTGSVTKDLVVNQASSVLNLTLNAIQGNVSISSGNSIYLNVSTITGDPTGRLLLYKDGTLINNGTSPIFNLTLFGSVGLFNITGFYSPSQNYSISSLSYFVDVTVDTTKPRVSVVYPLNYSNFSVASISVNYTASDETALDSCWWTLNAGVTNNSITCGSNISRTWSSGINNVTVYANDTSNNKNSSSVTFTVDTTFPLVRIYSPENRTYHTNNLYLNYSATDNLALESVFYSVYNSSGGNVTANTTLNANITLSLTDGVDYVLRVYANDSAGNLNGTESVLFNLNNTVLFISYDEYRNRGNTTNLDNLTESSYANLSGLVLENPEYGQIQFNESVNLSFDKDVTNVTNLDAAINISSNNVFINSSVLVGLNKSAKILIYNLSFTNPRVLKDGSACSSPSCVEESYSGGAFVFNVTGFSIYSADETPVDTGGGNNGGGGGGGGSTKPTDKFSVSPTSLSVKTQPGSVVDKDIVLTSKATTSLTVSITASKNLNSFLPKYPSSATLNSNESKIVTFQFVVDELVKPDVYPSVISFKSGAQKTDVPVIIEVSSPSQLFDVHVNIPDQFKTIAPGSEISSEISLANLGETQRVDVVVDYGIKDLDGNIIASSQKTLAVLTQTSFVASLQIPSNTPSGDYVFYTIANYDNKTAVGSDSFKVKAPLTKLFIYIGISVVILIVIIVLSYLYLRSKRKRPVSSYNF